MDSRFCSALADPQLTQRSCGAGRWMRLNLAAWDCTLFARAWTKWNSHAIRKPTHYDWRNICIPQSPQKPAKRESTLQIAARRIDKTTIFDVTGDIDLANSPEVRK